MNFFLIYSNSKTVGDAVAKPYSLGSIVRCANIALLLLLQGLIKKAFKETKSVSWPPTPEDLEDPNHLMN